MAEVHYCDICDEILRKEVYILSIAKVENLNEVVGHDAMSATDFLSVLKKRTPKIREICPSCKKVLEHFFKIRITKLREIQKEIEKIYRQSSRDKKPPRKIIELPPRKNPKKKNGK